MKSIEFWSCCGPRAITVTVDPDMLSDEAWRLARCLRTTNLRRRDSGVLVRSLRTNLELAAAAGWGAERISGIQTMNGDWANAQPIIVWQCRPLHVWPDHRHGPHADPDPERLGLLTLAHLQREAAGITSSGGTVIAAGDRSIRLAATGTGPGAILLGDDQEDELRFRQITALFG